MDRHEARFERHGGPPNLPMHFSVFVKTVLKGRSLDENFDTESAAGEMPDFGVYRDLVLIEMKSLEVEQQDRIRAVIDEKVTKEEMPVFYGERKINISSSNFRNKNEIINSISSKLNRSIEGILRKANSQLRSYRARNPRKNSVNICVILNSSISEYSPEVVLYAIHNKMHSGHESQRFESIDCVLYISEKHFNKLPDGGFCHPILVYEGMGLICAEWKADVVNGIVKKWSLYRTGAPNGETEDFRSFLDVEDIPNELSRSDLWSLEYDRNPYLKDFSIKDLRVHFNRVFALLSLGFVKGDWPRPSPELMQDRLRQFQHAIREINRREADVRDMSIRKLEDKEFKTVFDGLPSELSEKLGKSNRNT